MSKRRWVARATVGSCVLLTAGIAGWLAGCAEPPPPANETLATAVEALTCRSIDIVASKTQNLLNPLAPTYADGSADFSPPVSFGLPTDLFVTSGNSGHGRLELTITNDATTIHCLYQGYLPLIGIENELLTLPGNKYTLLSCDGGVTGGSVVTARHIAMHVRTSSLISGKTTVQLLASENVPCAGGGTDCAIATINDNNACTTDACGLTTGVTHTPVAAGSSCTDGNACNGAESCDASATCQPGTPPTVDDSNACTTDACTPSGGVTHTPVAAGTSCADSTVCNGAESCNATGTCQSGTPLVSDDGNACTADACDPVTGVSHTPLAAGASCSDGNVCNGAETCSASTTCVAGAPPNLDDNNACTVDACTPAGGITHTPTANGSSCSDGDPCNGVELCNGSGSCQAGTPLVTDDSDACTADACLPDGSITHTITPGALCGNSTDLCSAGDRCDAQGACVLMPTPDVDDENVSTIDYCDPATGVHHVSAPPNDMTVSTTVFASLSYLYAGPEPVQFNVAPGTIQVQRASAVFGHVVLENGDPAMLAEVRVVGHPEFGSTIVDAHGDFRMVVNGGGPLTVSVTYPDYLEAQRTVNAPWNDYAHTDDMMLVARDPASTLVELNALDMQAAEATVQTDGSGTRRATLLIPPGTSATMVFPDGSTAPLTEMNVRATEFTVGPQGRTRMPAALPKSTSYTYAVEINADEAVAAGAREVLFNQTMPLYVDNYYGFPVGTAIPKGVYDRERATWVSEPDGIVLKIVATPGGIADVDLDGDNVAETQAELDAIGLSPAEREELGFRYAAGKTLWRMPITHFTQPCDFNVGTRPDCGGDCEGFNAAADIAAQTCDGCTKHASVIECDNGIVGERIAIPGTSVALSHFSDRAAGYTPTRRVRVPFAIADAGTRLVKAQVVMAVAGRRFTSTVTCPCAPDAATDLVWDGKDDQGRAVQGAATATISLTHYYPAIMGPPNVGGGGGGGFGGAAWSISAPPEYDPTLSLSAPDAAPYLYELTKRTTATLYNWDARGFGLGGWTLTGHDAYDTTGGFLRRGDGSRRTTETLPPIALKVAQAATVGVAVAPDGARFYSTAVAIFRQAPDGTTTQITSGAGCSATADNVPSLQFCGAPRMLVLGADQSLFFALDEQVYRIDPEGILHRVAGRRPSLADDSGDGGLAVDANLSFVDAIAVAPDGTLYIATRRHRIKRVATNGYIYAFAGNGTSFSSGDGGVAGLAGIGLVSSMAVGPEGNLYFNDFDAGKIRRITPAGFIDRYAGGGTNDSGNGVHRLNVLLTGPDDLVIAPDGSIYVATRNVFGWNSTVRSLVIRVIEPNGMVRTVAGTGTSDCPSGTGGACADQAPATKVKLQSSMRLALGPAGDLLVTDGTANRLLSIRDPLPNLIGTAINIPEEDGETLLTFDTFGRHIKTVDATTATELEHFGYDSEGYLTSITDRDGLVLTIERDANHRGTAIIGPYGHRTELTIDANDDLTRVEEPTGAAWNITYANGLITEFENPNGHASTLSYDTVGRLIADHDAGGSGFNLTRTGTSPSWSSTLTSAMGRATTHANATLDSGLRTRDVTFPTGLTSHWTMDPQKRFTLTTPDGVLSTLIEDPDPRFGMFSPLGSGTVTQPSGRSKSFVRRRSVSYNSAGSILDVDTRTDTITLNGRTASLAYEANDDIETLTSATGRTMTNQYDTVGHLIQRDVPLVLPVVMTYDPDGRLLSQTQGTRQTSWTYGPDGMVATVTNPLNEITAFTRDANGRVTKIVRPDLEETLVGYDAAGNVIHVLPPGKPTHDFTFDARELVSQYNPPDASSGATPTSYTHNLDKQLTDEDQPGPRNVHVSYDTAGRHSTTAFPTGTLTSTYDGVGRLSTLSGPTGETLTYAYDGALVTSTTFSGEIAGVVAWTYDTDFRPTTETVNGGFSATMTYDGDSLLTGAGALTISRDAQNGRVIGTSANTVTDGYTFNDYGEVNGYAAAASGAPLLSFTYARDALGRITSKTETVLGVSKTFGYTYNSVGRLTDVTENGTLVEHYVYDANGNRTSSTNGAGTFAATFDDQDRIQTYGGVTYTFGANGELAYSIDPVAGTTGFTYDALGNLRQVALPTTTIEYLVDAAGRRIGKKVNGTLVRRWLWRSALQPVAELDGAGNVVARFVYGGSGNVPDLMVTATATYRIVTDHLGSVRLVVDAATGAVAQEMAYDAWGRVLVDTNPGLQPFGFAGGMYDADTGLVGFGARDYDAGVGRWISRDGAGLRGGPNLYEYAHSNPISYVDRNGNNPWLVAAAGVAATFVAGVLLDDTPSGPSYGGQGLLIVGEAGSDWTLEASTLLDVFHLGGRKERGAFLLHAHGNSNSVSMLSENLDAQGLADLLSSDHHYTTGQAIQLDSCNTGVQGGIGQQLSKLLGVRVIAPTGTVDVYGNVSWLVGDLATGNPESHAWNVYENGELVDGYD